MDARTITARCACGWETTGVEEAVVDATVEHGRRMHNMVPTREDVLAMSAMASDRPSDPPSDPNPGPGAS